MAAKNQFKVVFLSVKYNIMRQMTNPVTFFSNISFMMLNNATFIVQWLILFGLKNNIGGYKMEEVLILWGLAASTFGFSNIFFYRAYELPYLIMDGKLDSFLVQPKNVLLGVLTSGSSISAIGDFLYGYLILCIFQFSIKNLVLFTVFVLTGGLILTAFAVIVGSISFWIVRGDLLSNNLINIFVNVSTYPDGIFKRNVKIILYTLIPTGLAIYMPIKLILNFNILGVLFILFLTGVFVFLGFFVFYRGLKRYTSSNLMNARI